MCHAPCKVRGPSRSSHKIRTTPCRAKNHYINSSPRSGGLDSDSPIRHWRKPPPDPPASLRGFYTTLDRNSKDVGSVANSLGVERDHFVETLDGLRHEVPCVFNPDHPPGDPK